MSEVGSPPLIFVHDFDRCVTNYTVIILSGSVCMDMDGWTGPVEAPYRQDRRGGGEVEGNLDVSSGASWQATEEFYKSTLEGCSC